MSQYIARAAIRLSWGIRQYSSLSLEGGLQAYSMYGSSACPLLFSPLCVGCGKADSCADTRVVRRRELIPQGQTGGLVIFEDHPNYWDAWGASHNHTTCTLQRDIVINGELLGFRCRDTSP